MSFCNASFTPKLIKMAKIPITVTISVNLPDASAPYSLPTIGIEFANKELKLEGTEIRLQIWDSAG